MIIGQNHEMPVGIRIAIEHDEGAGRPQQNEIFRIMLRILSQVLAERAVVGLGIHHVIPSPGRVKTIHELFIGKKRQKRLSKMTKWRRLTDLPLVMRDDNESGNEGWRSQRFEIVF